MNMCITTKLSTVVLIDNNLHYHKDHPVFLSIDLCGDYILVTSNVILRIIIHCRAATW